MIACCACAFALQVEYTRAGCRPSPATTGCKNASISERSLATLMTSSPRSVRIALNLPLSHSRFTFVVGIGCSSPSRSSGKSTTRAIIAAGGRWLRSVRLCMAPICRARSTEYQHNDIHAHVRTSVSLVTVMSLIILITGVCVCFFFGLPYVPGYGIRLRTNPGLHSSRGTGRVGVDIPASRAAATVALVVC